MPLDDSQPGERKLVGNRPGRHRRCDERPPAGEHQSRHSEAAPWLRAAPGCRPPATELHEMAAGRGSPPEKTERPSRNAEEKIAHGRTPLRHRRAPPPWQICELAKLRRRRPDALMRRRHTGWTVRSAQGDGSQQRQGVALSRTAHGGRELRKPNRIDAPRSEQVEEVERTDGGGLARPVTDTDCAGQRSCLEASAQTPEVAQRSSSAGATRRAGANPGQKTGSRLHPCTEERIDWADSTGGVQHHALDATWIAACVGKRNRGSEAIAEERDPTYVERGPNGIDVADRFAYGVVASCGAQRRGTLRRRTSPSGEPATL